MLRLMLSPPTLIYSFTYRETPARAFRSPRPRRPFTISVEGNIGAGKTTFLDRFSPSEDNVEVMAEPVDRWRDVKGNNLLSLMYEDPARYSLLFQTYVQLTMLQQHNKECDADKDAKIMERSLLRIDKILKMIVSDLESCKDPF
jgi:deoxyadenosine/deoxycytidine kinase